MGTQKGSVGSIWDSKKLNKKKVQTADLGGTQSVPALQTTMEGLLCHFITFQHL